jgi:aspartate aminotransferase/aminotransferase
MAKAMTDPINLSIGLPDFDVADPVKAAAVEAIERGFNAYTVTQGIPELRGKIQEAVDAEFRHADRQVLITSGSSGALLLALCCVVEPRRRGDRLRPVLRHVPPPGHPGRGHVGPGRHLPRLPDRPGRVAAALTGRTKCVVVNSPANPTGAVASADEMRRLAELCRRRGVLLISDEVYRAFCYDRPFASPAAWNEDVLVVDGFSKSHGMTGWRLGYAHGPGRLIQEMAKLQQFSYVCAPSLVQKAGVVALDQDLSAQIDAYRRKRDAVVAALADAYELPAPEGAFYAFPRAPWGTASEFVAEAIRRSLLIIPGNVFSRRDTHFRISYAVDDATLKRGLDVLRELASTAP